MLRRFSDCSGTNLLEAAIVTPLLLMLTFGLIDFSSLFYTYLTLEHGVSQATRFAITGNQMNDPKTGSPMSREGSIKAAMRRAMPALQISDGAFNFSHMSPGSSSWVGGTGNANDIGRVTIQYAWRPLTPILRPFLTNGEMIVRVESAMKNESRFE
jgi:Flp pilus assembly protein TadG